MEIAINDPNYVPRVKHDGYIRFARKCYTSATSRLLVKVLEICLIKTHYKPGGKWSKHLKQLKLQFNTCIMLVMDKSTTDKNALLHGDNWSKVWDPGTKKVQRTYAGKKYARTKYTNLWWSTDDMTYGKLYYMERNLDGLAIWDMY